MTTPRIAPLQPAEIDQPTRELLDSFNLSGPDGSVLNIFATLARHPKLFSRWTAFGGTLLYRGRLEARDRELLILRTAWNTSAEYEWGQHVLIGRRAGVAEEDLARLPKPLADAGWPAADETLLRAADELHADARIGDRTWAALADRFDEQQLIEICMLVGQYHLVAFTLNSLGVQPEPGLPELPERPADG